MTLENYELNHIEAARKLACECMVLVKKDGKFPLSAAGQIAVYGRGARQTIKGGTGSGDVNSRYYITVEEGLKHSGFKITTGSWLDAYDKVMEDAKVQFVKDIKRKAKELHVLPLMIGMGAVMPSPDYELPLDGQGDTAIYVVARQCGEGNDRTINGDVKLNESEIRDILACNEKYENFMLVLNIGGVVDISPVKDVKNILIMSQLGAVTGGALADVILGKAYPSGKLTATWTCWEDYPFKDSFGGKDETRYEEGIYVGYRYFDSVGKKPLFPFGYGLGYTEFELSGQSLKLNGYEATVSCVVSNIGSHKGKEVVEVYATAPWDRLDHPYQDLIGFSKSKELSPVESETVEVSFNLKRLASYDTKLSAYILEKGDYVIRVGNSSDNTKVAGVIRVKNTIIAEQLSPVGGTPDFEDFVPKHTWNEVSLRDVPIFEIAEDVFADFMKPVEYQVSDEVKTFVEGLPDEEALLLTIGSHDKKISIASVIGEASLRVAGAAGESCGKVSGVEPFVMADGPAGLRLAREYYSDAKGNHGLGDIMPDGMIEYLPGVARLFLGGKKKPKGTVKTQYCTAIPIGTAIAQSWNLNVAEALGDIVGTEMERFNVDLWLAPAFNIQRSILCGRNFEYYSEDPLLSGLFGAAITLGVQKHKGKGTTIKHFCCNNQEFNRYQNDSIVSERALREIYIKGFEICIKKSQPFALMTSYNLLNGVHTSEREDLTRTVLRKEWGYTGLVMTDWIVSALNDKSSKNRVAHAAPVIAAGGNLFMPGDAGNYQEALDALRGNNSEFSLTRAQVNEGAQFVVDMSRRCRGL